MKTWPNIAGELADYVDNNWLRDSPLKRRLRDETAKLPQAGMQISAHQGQQMGLLARAIGARRVVEVGTFTGYSALCVAEVLPADGKLWCCDVSEEWTRIGRRYWKDTLFVDKGKSVKVRMRYETFDGDFVLHCHILDHEDQGMMETVRIAPGPQPVEACPPLNKVP